MDVQSIRTMMSPAYASRDGVTEAYHVIPDLDIGMPIQRCLVLANEVAVDEEISGAATRIFEAVLTFIWASNYQGACHSTSAVIFMLMREAGLDPKLCIGEVFAPPRIYFDHSWVELDGLVFDAAVSCPLADGEPVAGPVFASIDLVTRRPMHLCYGRASGKPFGEEAMVAVRTSLTAYSSAQPDVTIWCLAEALSVFCGVNVTAACLQERYGDVVREIRTPTALSIQLQQ